MTSTATTADERRSLPGTVVRALWSPQTWRATSHVVTGAVVGLVSFVVVLTLLVLTVVLLPTLIGAAIALLSLLVLGRVFTAIQRSRFEAFLDVSIPREPAAAPRERFGRRILHELRDRSTWRQLGYHLFAGVFGLVAAVVVIGVWSAGLALAPAIGYAASVAGIGVDASAGLTAAGVVLLVVAPWVARALAAVDATVGRALLGADPAEELTRRVASLAASRDSTVDAADAERRRIERDLHDGAQQRLTSLAVNLGVARTNLTDAPEPAREAIAQAHDEAKQALVELRDLVRGMHPAVLDDRGLDAALSGIAARSPVPVRLDVKVSERAAPEVEAVAYFVVSEALTNAVAHAGATGIEVTIERHRDRLRVRVTDDGRGGADAGRGTGLHGLDGRVRSVDGTLHVDSPAGGPTTVTAEMPCEL
ncbi:signal transduction histidine kinase [Haloactinopolyspora alba]|uniref:histidine kinase n=1 Tax=Haloactinopolyspora alba TaxID=648780 RepID=A0A2P8DY21_9ACTN|nr:signal transduction histidine kinase [Haloactinopolyspora alba]